MKGSARKVVHHLTKNLMYKLLIEDKLSVRTIRKSLGAELHSMKQISAPLDKTEFLKLSDLFRLFSRGPRSDQYIGLITVAV